MQPEVRLALGRYEVTRGEYAAFARATGYARAADATCFRQPRMTGASRMPAFFLKTRPPPGGIPASVRLTGIPLRVGVCTTRTRMWQWLTRTTGATYRLPTDTEWKHAAQGARGECAANGADVSLKPYLDVRFDATFGTALACEGSDGAATTSGAGSYPPNGIGLFDIVGNVWEWTGDCWKDDCRLRVARGGSWFYGPKRHPRRRPPHGQGGRSLQQWRFPRREDARLSTETSLPRSQRSGPIRSARTSHLGQLLPPPSRAPDPAWLPAIARALSNRCRFAQLQRDRPRKPPGRPSRQA